MHTSVKKESRQAALSALLSIEKGMFADEALHRELAQAALTPTDRNFVTELVYGITRRRRTLDELIQQLSTSKGDRPPRLIHLILRLGLYQLRYLNQVPDSAAVNTSVELAKNNRLGGLSGFVNGVLRAYARRRETALSLPSDPVARLGIHHSYPDWIIQVWRDQLASTQRETSHASETSHERDEGDLDALCHWFNQPPSIDLRVNIRQTSVEHVRDALNEQGIQTDVLLGAPQSIRLQQHCGAIQSLPGYDAGWWTVQDGSAQFVSHLLDPQPGEIVIDACAAPGGKTTHLAELMDDCGTVWACDRNAKRLKRVQENMTRLNLTSIQLLAQDMRSPQSDLPLADRVLVDAPCSGLGTLHRHADARWRQSPDRITELAVLQQELLTRAAQQVKPEGTLVYATCTLHPQENEAIVQTFLEHHPQWAIAPVAPESPLARFQTSAGWLTIWPHHHNLDGFFMARFRQLP
ncbi:MAG: 16S rRNA (cytosine(967)-C(5))-methyltransferase [Cyanobacteria bacterium P01_A01_bin.37]